MTDEEITALEEMGKRYAEGWCNYCMHKDPWAAHEFCADKLTEEQINIARKQQNDRRRNNSIRRNGKKIR